MVIITITSKMSVPTRWCWSFVDYYQIMLTVLQYNGVVQFRVDYWTLVVVVTTQLHTSETIVPVHIVAFIAIMR